MVIHRKAGKFTGRFVAGIARQASFHRIVKLPVWKRKQRKKIKPCGYNMNYLRKEGYPLFSLLILTFNRLIILFHIHVSPGLIHRNNNFPTGFWGEKELPDQEKREHFKIVATEFSR
jgi:hypothetical protein